MNCKIEKICRLCLSTADLNFDAIDDVTKNIIYTLSIKIDFSLTKNCVMCKNCANTVQNCFDLVNLCQNTKDTVTPLHLSEDAEKKNDDVDYKLCLFCMGIVVKEVCNSLRQLEEDIVALQGSLSNCIFELYATATEEPVLCKFCHDSLQNYMNFSKNCMDIEEKIKNQQLEWTNVKQEVFICSQDALKVFKEEDDFCKDNISIKPQIKKDYMEIDEAALHTAVKLDDNEPESSHLQKTSPIPQESYNCPSCPFTTTTRRYLMKHSVRHSLVIPLFKCDVCSFTTRHKWYLSTHALCHSDGSDVPIHKCTFCKYQTKYPKNMKRHLNNHNANLQFKCDKCPFVTKQRICLRRHAIVHKSPSEITMHKCEICPYESRFKKNLTTHMLIHKDETELTMYECDVCDYKAKSKCTLNFHVLKHKDESEVKLFKCEFCSYTSRRKSNLNQHSVVHKKTSEINLFICDICGYKAKWKSNLVQHMVVHNAER